MNRKAELEKEIGILQNSYPKKSPQYLRLKQAELKGRLETKKEVIEVLENELVSCQEECSSKYSSDSERKESSFAYKLLESIKKKIEGL